MSRNIYLYGNKKGSIANFDSISLEMVDRIINHSVDMLYCDAMNETTNEQREQIIPLIMNKIRVGGTAVFKFINAKIIAKAYYDNAISDDDISLFFQDNKSILSIDKLNALIDDNFIVSRIEYQDYNIIATITRIGLT
jgi:hypothetical protein